MLIKFNMYNKFVIIIINLKVSKYYNQTYIVLVVLVLFNKIYNDGEKEK